MISTRDIDEPTWPRSPPSSARITRRRRYLERSSSGGLATVSGVASARTAISGVHFLRHRGKEATRAVELPDLCFAPAVGVAGQNAALPALGYELIEHDEHPAQREQRKISAEPPFEYRIFTVHAHRRTAEAVALGRRKRPARMQQNVCG